MVDTSAWVHYLRATASESHHHVRRLVQSDATVHTTDVVVIEVLAGGRDETHVGRLRRLLRAGLDVLHADEDFDALARHTELRLYTEPASGP